MNKVLNFIQKYNHFVIITNKMEKNTENGMFQHPVFC